MRVKKRLKKRVKKGIKSVKSASPEAYIAGAGGLVGSAAVLLLTATKSGRELLVRTAQVTRRSEADEPARPTLRNPTLRNPTCRTRHPVSRLAMRTLRRSQPDTNGDTSPRPHRPEAAHSANARSAAPGRPRPQG